MYIIYLYYHDNTSILYTNPTVLMYIIYSKLIKRYMFSILYTFMLFYLETTSFLYTFVLPTKNKLITTKYTPMNKVLKSRIEKLRLEIEPLNAKDAAKACKKEVKYLLATYSPSTARTYLTTYRKVLNIDKVSILNALSVPNSVQNKIERDYKKSIAKRQKRGTKINNIDTMIHKAIELLDSDHIGELVAGLALLTGRRATEILKTAKFTNYKSSQKDGYFVGQLKTKETNKKYKIYFIGGTRDKCKKALKKLRKLAPTKTLSNNEVARKYENLVNSSVHRHFSSFVGVMDIDRATAHTLRNVYALQCTKEYKKEWQTTNSFLAEILGHEQDDVSTANSYQKYYISK